MHSGKIVSVSLLMAGPLLLSMACSKKKSEPEHIYASNSSGFEKVELIVNGQPVRPEIMTRWIINGTNRVEVRARRSGEYASQPYRIGLYQANSLYDENAETIWERSTGDTEPRTTDINDTFEFEAGVPFQWTWQTADDIGKLTRSDKDDILRILNRMSQIVADKQVDYRAFAREFVAYWGPGTELPGDSIEAFEKLVSEVGNYPDLTVEMAPKEKMEFVAGTKVVNLRAKEGKLLYCGHARDYESATGECVVSLGSDSYYFCKVRGKWLLLSF